MERARGKVVEKARKEEMCEKVKEKVVEREKVRELTVDGVGIGRREGCDGLHHGPHELDHDSNLVSLSCDELSKEGDL
jgi:hypothetical protein